MAFLRQHIIIYFNKPNSKETCTFSCVLFVCPRINHSILILPFMARATLRTSAPADTIKPKFQLSNHRYGKAVEDLKPKYLESVHYEL